MVIKLKDYRVAKAFSEDSIVILKIIDLAIRSLSIYSHYKPIQSLLQELKNCKVIIEAHRNTSNKILASSRDDAGGSNE